MRRRFNRKWWSHRTIYMEAVWLRGVSGTNKSSAKAGMRGRRKRIRTHQGREPESHYLR